MTLGSSIFLYLCGGFLLLIVEIVYLSVARKYEIVDIPNQRSSHLYLPVRGGGLIFPLAGCIWYFFAGTNDHFFLCGLVILAVVSYTDDMSHVYFLIRLLFQCAAILLAILQLDNSGVSIYVFIIYFITMLYFINIYNFMDGINGLTALYSLVTVLSFAYVNYKVSFTEQSIFIYLAISLAIFLFFNFRSRAVCFSGDVGSTGLAYIIGFIALLFFTKTMQFQYVLFFAIYLIDSGFTILQRILNGENITTAHRSHLYQILSNEIGMPHRLVSSLFAVVQLAVNLLFLFAGNGKCLPAIILCSVLIIFYLALRLTIQKKINGYYIFR